MNPIIFIVDPRDEVVAALATDIRHRFGMDYDVRVALSASDGMQVMEELARAAAEVALIIAGEELPAGGGLEFLAAAHSLHPDARRILMVGRGRWTSGERVVQAMTLGRLEGILFHPWALLEPYLYPTIGEHLSDWSKERPPAYEAIRIVEAPGDARAHEIRETLVAMGVPFGSYRPDTPDGRQLLEAAGVEDLVLPVIVFQTGRSLIRPTLAELAGALGMRTTPASDRCDLVIVGAGPAGLAAAVYAASEGLDTMIVEPQVPGGQAGSSSLIRNYLGFTRGIAGDSLAIRAFEQAWMFGCDFVLTQAAEGLRVDGHDRLVSLSDGSEVRADAVVIASGVMWRRLGVPSLESLVGAGVFYGASRSEARGMEGEDVFVVGGGNSAGQAAVYLARHADSVTLLVRAATLGATMSEYLIGEIHDNPSINVLFNTEVVGGGGSGRLEELTLRDRTDGVERNLGASALFVMIGAEPHTNWLPPELSRDDHGFIRTGSTLAEVASSWPLDRLPLPTETSIPGVFAAGDVVAGSVKRVASAVGAGAVAIDSVHRYLASHDR